MVLQSVSEGLIVFNPKGKTILKPDKKDFYTPITQFYSGEVPTKLHFQEGSTLTFRFGLDGQRFTNRQKFYEGHDGTKEVFLQPSDYRLERKFLCEGYKVKQDGIDLKSDFGRRVTASFSDVSLEHLLFVQTPQIGKDAVVLMNRNGELRFEYDHGFFIAAEYAIEGEPIKVYVPRGKDPAYREPNLMAMSAIPDHKLQKVGKAIVSNPTLGLRTLTEEDLFHRIENEGIIIDLGPQIK